MSIGEKLQTVAENLQKVYDAGRSAEYDRFWDENQAYGNRTNYQYAYIGFGFSFENFYPKYDIRPTVSNATFSLWDTEKHKGSLKKRLEECGVTLDTSATTLLQYFYSSNFTELPTITMAGGKNTKQIFANCKYLETIEKVVVSETTTYTSCFDNTEALKNVIFEGVIAQTGLNFQWSPLSVDSMKSIISCLKDFSGTTSEHTCEIIFSDNCWAALEADSTAPDGGTWKIYVQSKGWNI